MVAHSIQTTKSSHDSVKINEQIKLPMLWWLQGLYKSDQMDQMDLDIIPKNFSLNT